MSDVFVSYASSDTVRAVHRSRAEPWHHLLNGCAGPSASGSISGARCKAPRLFETVCSDKRAQRIFRAKGADVVWHNDCSMARQQLEEQPGSCFFSFYDLPPSRRWRERRPPPRTLRSRISDPPSPQAVTWSRHNENERVESSCDSLRRYCDGK